MPFCTLFAGLGNTNKSAISHLFSSYLTLALSLPPGPSSFLLPQSLWQESFFFSSCSIRLQWVSGHSFLPGNDADNKLARPGALLVPSAIPFSLSPFISCIHSSRTGGVLSGLNSSTYRFPRFSPRNLLFLVTLAVFSPVFVATSTAFC